MNPKIIKITGQLTAIIAVLLAGAGAFLMSISNVIPGDYHDIIFTLAAFLAALSAFLAHKNGGAGNAV